jgi:hypothetical protein
MRLFDLPPIGNLKTMPAELVHGGTIESHDGFTSTWPLVAGVNPLMVCLYNGSGTYYRARPSPAPSDCTMRHDNGLTQAWCGEP